MKKRTKVKRSLMRLLDDHTLSAAVVQVAAGDVEPTAEQRREIRALRRRRKEGFYSDLLFALSHQYYPPSVARELWQAIQARRDELRKALGRNPGVMVAALDYLTNDLHAMKSPIMMERRRFAEVAEVALKDGLTGLLDHATFLRRLRAETRRSERYGDGFALLMLDLDDFKAVNDNHGHPAGDRVLATTAKIIAKTARETDYCARYGGEEFALLAPRTSVRDAVELAERLRKRIERRFARVYHTTVSIGVAGCPRNGETSDELVEAADQALYRAKKQGKNRVVRA